MIGEEGLDQCGFHLIDGLEGPGISTGDIKKLKEAGLHTVEMVAHSTKKDLASIKGLSDNKVEKLIEAAFKMIGGSGFTSATEVRYSPTALPDTLRGASWRRTLTAWTLLHVFTTPCIPAVGNRSSSSAMTCVS